MPLSPAEITNQVKQYQHTLTAELAHSTLYADACKLARNNFGFAQQCFGAVKACSSSHSVEQATCVSKEAESAYLLEVLLAGILISWPHIRAVGACPVRVLKGYTGRWHAGGRQAMGGQGPRAVGLLMPWPQPRSHRSACGLQCSTVLFMSKKQKSCYTSDADCKQTKQSYLLCLT